MNKTICDIAVEILRTTSDGNQLAPHHLALVQLAVNTSEDIDEPVELEFYRLAKLVELGYVKPWFHGVEHMTLDHEGYVYWKGKHVEHYNLPWAYSDEAKEQLQEIRRRCLILEKEGKKINSITVCWAWQEEAEG